MRKESVISLFLIFLTAACVDRVFLDIPVPDNYAVVVDGMITDQPGPYKVELTKAFDIESKNSFKAYISARRVTISDNAGNSEDLTQISQGVYQTDPNGIQGVVGRVYKLRVEMLDGRVYESKPDSMAPPGNLENVYFNYVETNNSDGTTNYGFDVLFDSDAGGLNSYYFLWKFVGTYQVETNPELYTVSCGEARCPAPLPCSAYILGQSGLEEVKPCECCLCWVNFFNDLPVVSDNQFNQNGKFIGVKAAYVPINQWTFLFKVHAEVQQLSISRNAFNFWNAIRTQKQAVSNIFQPVTGKIPTNLVQVSGTPGPIEGIFFAASVATKSVFITPMDVPDPNVIPEQDLPYPNSCLTLFPFSTTTMPTYWE
jgi:hypothetical protein